MIEILALILCLFLSATPLFASGLGTPSLSAPLATARFFDPDRFLTTGGMKYPAADDLTLEPEWGLGYHAMERQLPGGGEESIHRVHAQAGWRLSSETLYLSAAAKLPVYTYESSGSYSGQDLGSRQGYDLIHPFKNALTWTGELGVHLSGRTDLTLYYDQNLISGYLPGVAQQEERIGTRIIWRFK
jgi:hypothetical protein